MIPLPNPYLGAAFLLFLGFFHLTPWGIPGLKRRSGGKTQIDLRLAYGPDDAYRLLAEYGAGGVALFRRMLQLDFVFPLVYGALFAEWLQALAAAAGLSGTAAALFALPPVLAALCDYVENILLLQVLAALPQRRDRLVHRASRWTGGKFLCSAVGLLVLAGLLARLLVS
jgi:hypothetical protein